MKPIKQYVSDQLYTLVQEFPMIQVSCRYDDRCETYYAKVLPAIEYSDNIDLSDKTMNILEDLLQLYPCESIIIFSEDSTINMDKADYTLTGKDFVENQLVLKS